MEADKTSLAATTPRAEAEKTYEKRNYDLRNKAEKLEPVKVLYNSEDIEI